MARRNHFPPPCAVAIDSDEFASLVLDLHLAVSQHPDDCMTVLLEPLLMSMRLTACPRDGSTDYYCPVTAGGRVHEIGHAVRFSFDRIVAEKGKKVWARWTRSKIPLRFGVRYAWVPAEPIDLTNQITKDIHTTSNRIVTRLKNLRRADERGTLMVIDEL
jgi:hypothetical protein